MKGDWDSMLSKTEAALVCLLIVFFVVQPAKAVYLGTSFEVEEGYNVGKLTPSQPNPIGGIGWGESVWTDLGGNNADPQGLIVNSADAPEGLQYYQRLGGGNSNLALREFPAISTADGDFSIRWRVRIDTDQSTPPYFSNFATIEVDDTGPGGRIMTFRYDRSGNINLGNVQNEIAKWDGTGNPALASALNQFVRGGLNVYWDNKKIEVFMEDIQGEWISIGTFSFRETNTNQVDRIFLGVGPGGTELQGVSWDDIVMKSELIEESAAAPSVQIPYPLSTYITGMTWQWDTHSRAASGSDNWAITWADDDQQYTAWGDGWGFTGTGPKISLGVSRIAGDFNDYVGTDLWGIPTSGEGGKSYGIVSIGGVLYMWYGPGSNVTSYNWQRLKASTDHGITWTDAPWFFPKSTNLIMSTICNFGRDYAGSQDNYVYSYFIRLQGNPSSLNVHKPGMIDLARAPKDLIMDEEAYEFFAGLDGDGEPMWTNSTDPNQRTAVFEDAEGVGWNLSVSYNEGLGRYILITEHTASFSAKAGFFEAPEPWGPWHTIAYYDDWGRDSGISDVGKTFFWNFSNKWSSDDGKDFVCIFTGTGDMDSFNAVKGQFVINQATVVGDFEGSLDGWLPVDQATLSLSTTGTTTGTESMLIEGPGGRQMFAKRDIKSLRYVLGVPRATVSVDVTAFAADMQTDSMSMEIIINGQDHDLTGEQNNIGLQSLGELEIVLDGTPHTLVWKLPESLTARIAETDEAIEWFEMLIATSNNASITKLYIDNVRLIGAEVQTNDSESAQ
jgi:hypothetical protein